MPKKPEDKRLNPDLPPDEYEPFHREAVKREWSDKKLCEIVIRAFLKMDNKDKFLETGKKER